MKAIVNTRYGLSEFFQYKEVETPVPNMDEVLIKVHASTVNDWDIGIVDGKPYFMRCFYGLLKPKPKVQTMGCDVSGVVESIGAHVSRFKIGDKVYGDLSISGFGAFAEYTCAREIALELIPGSLSFEQAASLPHSVGLAWQGLFDKMDIKSGQTLLINGAAGGVGPLAMQLAKRHGLEVTGVDRGDKLDMMREAGFDHVIDYTETDFTRDGNRYDWVLDVKTTRYPFAYLRSLLPGGTYVTVGGYMPQVFTLFALGWLIKLVSGKKLTLLGLRANRGLAELADLLGSGEIQPAMDGPYALRDAAEAMRYYRDANQWGRIIIKVC